uniref:Uncharacterized protein n=1 Tax=Kalanchoe fedtschenkoi TaxID=63787 RepID=A0A7N0UZD8_KALFE
MKWGLGRKRHRISRVIRAVFFETSLARRIRSRKLRRQPSRWEIREPSEEGSLDVHHRNSSETEKTEVSCSTESTRTICLLAEEDERDEYEVQKHEDSSKCGACFFPAGLAVLILWGKVCAIFFTSTWLLFITPRSRHPDSSPSPGGRGLHLKHYLRGPLSGL